MPECPNCKGKLTILHGLQCWNPWRYKCPLCDTILQYARRSKLLLIPFGILGLLIAGIAIYQEETGKWVTTDSIEFFAYAFIVILVLAILSWPLTQFIIKKDA